MKIFLAGQHTYPGLIAELCGGGSGEVFIKQGAKAAMRLFMAGGVSGNLNPLWKESCRRMAEGQPFTNATEDAMKIFLAGGSQDISSTTNSSKSQKKNEMRIYLAGIQGKRKGFVIDATIPRRGLALAERGGGYDETVTEYRPYILESFFYADEDTERLIPYFGDFLLDSGAFTFMQGKGGQPDWNEYIERYAAFIVRNKVEKYFELDVDSVVGYDKVLQFRAKLEKLTGRQSIPVWHRSRGQDEYIRHCEEYPYVAIGGLVDGAKKGEYARQYWKYFPWFINTAHKNGAKIHALGFTSLEGIRQFHFDSVDSTAWTTGNRFGYLYYFDGQTIRKKDAPKGHRICDPRTAALNNYVEWIKFQKYADKHL